MSNMELPDRSAVLGHVAELMARHRSSSEHARVTDGRPALLVIHIEGHAALCARDPLGSEAAMREVARRLDRLVRSGDLLGRLAPDMLVVAVDISPAVAGALVERVRGAVAMPVEVAGELISLVATIGLALADDARTGTPADAELLLGRAEADAALQQGGGPG
jgi:GGDEF domain-containing protein